MIGLINSIPFSINCKSALILPFLLLLFSMGLTTVNAQSPTEIFENGNSAYNEGNFEKAIEYYQEVLNTGRHSAALYFNLGNAFYRLNNVAESIYYFEKAKQLDAKDSDIQYNSAFANNMTIDAIEALPESQLAAIQSKIFKIMSLNGWAYAFVILAWIVLLFFLGYLFYNNPTLKRSFFTGFLISLFLLIGTFNFIYFSYQEDVHTEYAIIFSEQINIWTEPNERADVQFILHEGTKVVLLDTLDEWQKIRIANGSEGWTKNASIRSLK